jgi:phosphate transport system protein
MPKLDRFFDQEFHALKTQILDMGAAVEAAIEFALRGLIDRNDDAFQKVHATEDRINRYHIAIDDACLRVLARQAPMASDLRFVLSCIKINSDLERMGDNAVNISHAGRHYISEPPLKPLIDLPKMAEEVRKMTRESLDAFFRRDEQLARAVIANDDIVDRYKNEIFREVTGIMKNSAEAVDRGMDLILISRNLERIGDHATNIAEDVIFVASGIDVRHGGAQKTGTTP